MLRRTLEALQPSFFQSDDLPRWNGIAFKPAAIIIAFVVGLWWIQVPQGLTEDGWHMLILFVATILGIILKPLPLGAWSLLGLSACIFTGTVPADKAMASFGKEVVWLVVFAFFMAKGFTKTGLGSRVAYTFVRIFGKSSLGLAYGLTVTDFFLAPTIPSVAARAGGVLFPILKSLSEEYGSYPDEGTRRKIGAYLMLTVFHVDVVASAIFLTAFAANPLALSIAKSVGVDISWMAWAKAAIVPGIVTMAVIPAVIYLLFPPEIKSTPEAPMMAREKLLEMGKLGAQEMVMLGTFLLLVLLWILGDELGIAPASAALLGVVILLATGVLNWGDIMSEDGAWTTLIWFAILLGMGSNMADLGVMQWFGVHMKSQVGGLSTWHACGTLVALFFVSHYFFASATAHVSSLYGIFLVTMMGAGVPGFIAALLLSWTSTLSSGVTHFSSSSAPIFFGANYLTIQQWWGFGLLISLLNIAIWGTLGVAWWMMLGIL